jgi:hypothetical protein
MIVLSGCTSVSILPEQESGYYAVGISMLIEDAVICKSNRPGYASAVKQDTHVFRAHKKSQASSNKPL